jgi:hypothetical protein
MTLETQVLASTKTIKELPFKIWEGLHIQNMTDGQDKNNMSLPNMLPLLK